LADLERDLERLRAEIDRIDEALLQRLNERARLVQEVGRLKRRAKKSVYSAARERDLAARLVESNPGPFPAAAIPHVFREIVSATRSLEERLRVTYLGPPGTFGHLAAQRQFGASAELEPVGSIPEVFAAVERREADFGVIPIENTTEGVVTETLDTFVESSLTLCGEILLRVSHQLMSRSGKLEEVRRVASHPQALAQCRLWLDRHLPGVERVELASTAAAAALAHEDASVAAIGSAIAQATYGLAPVARAIEDRRDNTTRFLVIGQETPPPSENDLTSAVFTVRKDQSGTLHRLLEPFARHGVNLTAIQSRPIKGKPWEYLFFLDLEGHRTQPPVAKALSEAAGRAHSYKILGSFPRAAGCDAESVGG
jgi:chorismate mutase/prephenate dehydratase